MLMTVLGAGSSALLFSAGWMLRPRYRRGTNVEGQPPTTAPKRSASGARWVVISSSIDTMNGSCTSSEASALSLTPMRRTG